MTEVSGGDGPRSWRARIWGGSIRLAVLASSASFIGAYIVGAALYSFQFRWRFADDLGNYTHPSSAPDIAGLGAMVISVLALLLWMKVMQVRNWIKGGSRQSTGKLDHQGQPVRRPGFIGAAILIAVMAWVFVVTMRPYLHLKDNQIEVIGYLETRSYDLTRYRGANLAFHDDERSLGYEVEFHDGGVPAYRVNLDARGVALILVGFVEASPGCPALGYNSRIEDRWRLALGRVANVVEIAEQRAPGM